MAMGKRFLFNGLLFSAAFLFITAKKCPQLSATDSKNAAHVESVNKRVQKLADDGEFNFKDDDGEYLYTVNLCQRISKIAVNQEELKGEKRNSYQIGLYKDDTVVGGTDWLLLTYYGKKYNTHCGSSKKRSLFFIQCDESATSHASRTPKIITEYAPTTKNNTFCYYLFEMKHSAACPLSTSTKISPGSVFIIIIVIITALYLLLGFLYQRFMVGAKGLEQIPNYLLWREFGTLQADGCNFICRSQTSRQPTRYKPMDDAIADDDDTDGEKDDTLLPV